MRSACSPVRVRRRNLWAAFGLLWADVGEGAVGKDFRRKGVGVGGRWGGFPLLLGES